MIAFEEATSKLSHALVGFDSRIDGISSATF